MTSPGGMDWRVEDSSHFVFAGRRLDRGSGRIELDYELDGVRLREVIDIPVAKDRRAQALQPAMENALDLLHWVAGISYWKAGCPARIRFEGRAPDTWQAAWLNRLYSEGLAEFAFRNELDPDLLQPFSAARRPDQVGAGRLGLRRRSLVPMGGGKDSLVAWSRLTRLGAELASIQVGSSPLIKALGAHLEGQHALVGRHLDPALSELNQRGAWNGHVPVTAINATILVLAALLLDYSRVVFANERSSDEPSLIDARGQPVNHQFSKSFAFERMLDDWIRRYIASDLQVFSLLRRDRELAVCREFAGLTEFHQLFSSCNRNFHLDGPQTERWCGRCPKCHFVFLALAPFMVPAALAAIFGSDLLADRTQLAGFKALLALDGRKPFECVGEADEARAAARALANDSRWSGHAVVQALQPALAELDIPDIASLCRPQGHHLIPEEWQDAA